MIKKYILNQVGKAAITADGLIITIDEKNVPAMKYLSLFSHATIIFSDGSNTPYHLRTAALTQVDEKAGQIQLETACGMKDGNVIYDIKPYIPCEDRIINSDTAKTSKADITFAPGGSLTVELSQEGVIRKERGCYLLYPDDFNGYASVVKKNSFIKVFWWFSRFDRKEYRRVTQGEPPYENAPRSGVFATRSPVRPNPIALTVVKVLEIDGEAKRIKVTGLDCFDNTPLMGIQSYHDSCDNVERCSVPKWLEHWPDHKKFEEEGKVDIAVDDHDEEVLAQYLDGDYVNSSVDFFKDVSKQHLSSNDIMVRGARQNNLQNIEVVIPKGKITVVVGVSGSGKSSLAFDTLYAESRIRMSETPSDTEKPDVDSVVGLPPAVAIAQKAIGRNPRSTAGTFTGIQDRLRLLFSAVGKRHCPECGKLVSPRSREEISDILTCLSKHKLEVQPFGSEEYFLMEGSERQDYWTAAADEFLKRGHGAFTLIIDGGNQVLLQTRQMCYHCEHVLFEMTPALFSFNNPESMCPVCSGLGRIADIDPDLIVARPHLSLLDGASDYWGDMRAFIKNPTANWMRGELAGLAENQNVNLETPWNELPKDFRQTALYGSGKETVVWNYVHPKNGRSGTITRAVEGVVPTLQRLMQKGGSSAERITEQYIRPVPCSACRGERLGQEGRMATVAGQRFPAAAAMTIDELSAWIHQLPDKLSAHDVKVSKSILWDLNNKTKHLQELGLAYLGLDRSIPTLSGGELQRLKLAAQMGLGLSGLLYVMDEPTAGLHPRDYPGIINILKGLKTEGNTVLVVEHEETVLRSADHLIEIGPGAGKQGGRVIWQGRPEEIDAADTQTGHYLSGARRIAVKRPPLPQKKDWVQIHGARANNLKEIDVTFPKGRITCISGVSGSGKSTLVSQVIAPAVANLIRKKPVGSCCQDITGAGGFKSVVFASQTPIGRSSRSNAATYIGIMDEIRRLFAGTQEAAAAGLPFAAFSFNNKEGQCGACKGEGQQEVSVSFGADIHTVCPVCAGKRYKKEVLKIPYQGKCIDEVLNLPVEEAFYFFDSSQKIAEVLQVLLQVGLGYLRLGQNTSTLSGGEAQRIKLAKALTEKRSGKMLYILDEPTSGLHFSDIQNLLMLMSGLAADGHTLLVVEHNRHILGNADWIIDLGPEGGAQGGRVLVQNTPEQVASSGGSYLKLAIRE